MLGEKTHGSKRVLRNFRYMECGAFAEYLHRMSLKGWHFTKWKAGLVFERGEPADITYCVEIFTKGSEMDERLGEDAKEFAEYCAAAGWKLIDGKRRYCIFRKEREDAVPIVTEEERFRNVCRAERGQLFLAQAGLVLVAGSQWFAFLTMDFAMYLFSAVRLTLLAMATLLLALRIFQGAEFGIWAVRSRGRIKRGGAADYGRTVSRYVWNAGYFLSILGIFLAAVYEGSWHMAAALAAGLALALLLIWVIAWLRPDAVENLAIQIGFVFLLLVLITALLLGGSGERKGNSAELPEKLPLTQEDYRGEDFCGQAGGNEKDRMQVTFVDFYEQKNIFGSLLFGRVDYTARTDPDTRTEPAGSAGTDIPTEGDPADEAEDSLSYQLYRSRFPWALDKIWEQEVPWEQAAPAPRAARQWGAREAESNRLLPEFLYLRYDNCVLIFSADVMPAGEQIDVVLEKLGITAQSGI